jgi:hypothetical protein
MNKINSFSLFKAVVCVAFLLLLQSSFVFGTHNTSRYFPFLERPAEYVIKNKSHISPSLFFAKASTAFKRGGGNTGIPELWGKYDLRDVIDSLRKVKGNTYDPIAAENAPAVWDNESIKYKVGGKVKVRGLVLNYEQDLKFSGLQAGCSLPVVHINTNDSFAFVSADSANVFKNLRDGEVAQLDRIRRTVNNDLGLKGGDWTKTGFGDLDLHLRFNHRWDYELMMRSIDLNLQTGLVVPTGIRSDIDYPSSVSLMGNGHWGTYFDIIPEFELKQDWKFGMILGAAYQFKNTRNLRISTYQEPAIFSALVGKLTVDPGMTFKLSPYIIAENLTDGLDFQFRYTYLRHNKDNYTDARDNKTIKSYLNQEAGRDVTAENISTNISQKKDLSKWRSHYLTLELVYDSKEAGNDWVLSPNVYMTFDYQFSGNAVCKTHQLTLGVELHF